MDVNKLAGVERVKMLFKSSILIYKFTGHKRVLKVFPYRVAMDLKFQTFLTFPYQTKRKEKTIHIQL